MSLRKDGKLRPDPTQPEKVETSPEGQKLASEQPQKDSIDKIEPGAAHT